MKKVTGIFEGEKIEMEEVKNKDGKLIINLYVLAGRESIKMSVRDNDLWQELKAVPNREPITVKAEVQEYKGELYLQAVALIS
jgi:ABC-type Fe3+-hydroxamate transport system substrate-binding protein